MRCLDFISARETEISFSKWHGSSRKEMVLKVPWTDQVVESIQNAKIGLFFPSPLVEEENGEWPFSLLQYFSVI